MVLRLSRNSRLSRVTENERPAVLARFQLRSNSRHRSRFASRQTVVLNSPPAARTGPVGRRSLFAHRLPRGAPGHCRRPPRPGLLGSRAGSRGPAGELESAATLGYSSRKMIERHAQLERCALVATFDGQLGVELRGERENDTHSQALALLGREIPGHTAALISYR